MDGNLTKSFRERVSGVGERTKAVLFAELTHDGQVHVFTVGSKIDAFGLIGMATTYQTAQALGTVQPGPNPDQMDLPLNAPPSPPGPPPKPAPVRAVVDIGPPGDDGDQT